MSKGMKALEELINLLYRRGDHLTADELILISNNKKIIEQELLNKNN